MSAEPWSHLSGPWTPEKLAELRMIGRLAGVLCFDFLGATDDYGNGLVTIEFNVSNGKLYWWDGELKFEDLRNLTFSKPGEIYFSRSEVLDRIGN